MILWTIKMLRRIGKERILWTQDSLNKIWLVEHMRWLVKHESGCQSVTIRPLDWSFKGLKTLNISPCMCMFVHRYDVQSSLIVIRMRTWSLREVNGVQAACYFTRYDTVQRYADESDTHTDEISSEPNTRTEFDLNITHTTTSYWRMCTNSMGEWNSEGYIRRKYTCWNRVPLTRDARSKDFKWKMLFIPPVVGG